jgi:cysteine desulfuration protein SufE
MGLSDVSEGRLHFLADSNAAITKGIVALILSAVQDRTGVRSGAHRHWRSARAVRTAQAFEREPTQGVPNMIALVRQTAERYASAA